MLIAGICIGLVAAVASVRVHDPDLQRRIYWLGWFSSALCFALAVLPRGWHGSLAVGFLALFAAAIYAYLRTPFLKIGGRVYAVFRTEQALARNDAYETAMGSISARTMWWVLVGIACIGSVGIYLLGWTWPMILCAVFLTAMGALAGVDDGSRKLPVARGQYVQAFIAFVASSLLWLAPAICYLAGYRVGQRWPMGMGRHARRPPDA